MKLEDETEIPLVGLEGTQTIDITGLFTQDVSRSGSFDIRGLEDVWGPKLGKLLQALPIPALFFSENLRIVGMNQACGRIGLLGKEARGKLFHEFADTPAEADRIVSLVREVYHKRKSHVMEARLRVGGAAIWGRLSLRPVRMSTDRYVLALIEDLTPEKEQLQVIQRFQDELQATNRRLVGEIEERTRAERALTEARDQLEKRVEGRTAQLQRLVSANPAVIYTCAPRWDYGATFVSPKVKTVLGRDPVDFIQNSSFRINNVHPDDVSRVVSWLSSILTGEGPRSLEYRFRGKDGRYRWIHDEITVIRDEQGQPLEMLGFWIDVSDRVEAQLQIKDSLQEKEVLLREIHHRVKNNLQIIHSMISLQADYVKDESVLSLMRDLQDRVRAMASAYELLYQSKNLAGLRVSEYLTRLIEHLVISRSSSRTHIRVINNLEGVQLSFETVVPLGFILTELVSNCVKHAFEPGAKAEVRVSLRSIGPEEFELTVSDNGVGIDEGYQIDRAKSLGLALVRIFVEQLEGTLEIRRKQGTEITIKFKDRDRLKKPGCAESAP